VHRLDDGTCEVWVAAPHDFAPHHADLAAVLSPAERRLVERQRASPSRELALLSRGLVRLVLAGYLDVDPAALDVDRSCPACGAEHGRPRLRSDAALHLSVAHCRDLLLLALDPTGPVGVDVEALPAGTGAPPAELVDLVLTPAERRRLARAAPERRWAVFLGIWTRKEAMVKRLGRGIPLPPDRRDVVRRTSGARVRHLDLGPAHVAAVATGAAVRRVRVTRASPHRAGAWWPFPPAAGSGPSVATWSGT
jgi:4'-phosphopantetheinyl transferase